MHAYNAFLLLTTIITHETMTTIYHVNGFHSEKIATNEIMLPIIPREWGFPSTRLEIAAPNRIGNAITIKVICVLYDSKNGDIEFKKPKKLVSI